MNQSNRRESGMSKRRKRRKRNWWNGGLKRMYCGSCTVVRLHRLATRVDDSGYFVRVWICNVATCCLSTPAGGFVCRMCGHPWFDVLSNSTGRYARPGVITRMKACRSCGTQHQTAERIERVMEASAIPERATGRPI